MADKLKIYACSGLDDASQKTIGYKYWSDGSDPVNNTQAVNSLIAKINLCRSQLLHLAGLTEDEKVDLLNEIAFYNVCLYFERIYTDNADSLKKAGMAIVEVFKDDKSYNPDLTIANCEAYIDSLVSQVMGMMDMKDLGVPKKSFAWIQKNMIDLNKVGLSQEARTSVRNAIAKNREKVGAARDGWQNDENIGEYLTNASEYFLYTYFTDEQIKKLPYVYKFKRKRQRYVYDYCKPFFVDIYGTEEDMQNVIRAGIVGYFNHQPEEVCTKICNGDAIKGVGTGDGGATAIVWTVADIIAVISACLTFLGTIIVAIIQMVKESKIAETKSIDAAAANAGIPNPEDSKGINWGDIKPDPESTSWVTMAIVAVGLLLLFKRD